MRNKDGAPGVYRSFFRALPALFKYQIVTKIALSAVVFPLFWTLAHRLIQARGVGAFSNHDLFEFFFSPQGALFLLSGAAVVLIATLLELCGFITVSARSLGSRPESSYAALLRSMLRMLPRMLDAGSLVLGLYLLVIIPLSGFGITLSFVEGLRIPNFIMSVIESNALYSGLLALVLLLFLWLGLRWIFTLHFVVIGAQRPKQALESSSKLVGKFRWRLLLRFLGVLFVNILGAMLLVGLWLAGIATLAHRMDFDSGVHRAVLGMLFLVQNLALGLLTMLFVPFEIHHLTVLFMRYTARISEFEALSGACPDVEVKEKRSLLDRVFARKKIVALLVFIAMTLISIPIAVFFDRILFADSPIRVVGHRGGGGFDVPENSYSSTLRSIEQGASHVEIDVQRASDGRYILNHDRTFKRLAGEPRTAQQMTSAEIRALDIGRRYPGYEGERVPMLDEFLDFCRGRIGVYIELKGSTADRRMADDMVRMVRERGMEDDVLIMSLDYELIRYVERTYEDVATGFVYFLALGDPGSFEADVIILEEDAATPVAVEKIHAAGKKAVVWTVNKPESMERFAASRVDAVITDDVGRMQSVLQERRDRTQFERYVELFTGE